MLLQIHLLVFQSVDMCNETIPNERKRESEDDTKTERLLLESSYCCYIKEEGWYSFLLLLSFINQCFDSRKCDLF